MNRIYIACDGACSGNGKDHSPGGWGVVLRYMEHEKELCGGDPSTTNNIMELTACIQALASLKNDSLPVTIYCDSAYVVNCFEQRWYIGWEKNGWRNAKKQPVENQDLWKQLLSLVRHRKTPPEFIKIKGHLDPTDSAAVDAWHHKLAQTRGERRAVDRDEYMTALAMNRRADELANRGMDAIRTPQR